MSRLKKFMVLETQSKVLLLQAWCLLGWFRATMLARPLKHLTGRLQHHAGAVSPAALHPAQREEAWAIGALVAAAASVTPWQSRCLVQVLVVQRLLEARGMAGQLCLGVRRDTEDTLVPGDFAAHAWLQCGDVIVNGGVGQEQYAVISTFSWPTEASLK